MNYRLPKLILLFNILIITACDKQHQLYLKEVKEFRMYTNDNFKNGKSPLKPNDKLNFKGLNYFEIDTNYRVTASLSKSLFPNYIQMNENEATPSMYEEVGVLKFKLKEKHYSLNAYIGKGDNLSRLFIPFKDLTNGKETYHSGRFLYTMKQKDGTYLIDFNYAHNPYCAYNDDYSCPVPPTENHLNTKIIVGEKSLFVEK